MCPYQPKRSDAVTSRVRLRGHDYSAPGAYFITSCIEGRHCFLGHVHDSVVHLSDAGLMVDARWQDIEGRFPHVRLDAWVIMPNHIHGIIMIDANDDGNRYEDSPSISRIMHWFHTRSTNDYITGVKSCGWPRYPGRLWQERYIDHIVRSDHALERIRTYIEANPSRWPDDEENPEGRAAIRAGRRHR